MWARPENLCLNKARGKADSLGVLLRAMTSLLNGSHGTRTRCASGMLVQVARQLAHLGGSLHAWQFFTNVFSV